MARASFDAKCLGRIFSENHIVQLHGGVATMELDNVIF